MFNVRVAYSQPNSRIFGPHEFLLQVDDQCQLWFSMVDLVHHLLLLSKRDIRIVTEYRNKPIEHDFVTESEVYEICNLIRRSNVHYFEMWVRNILFPTMIERFLTINKPTPETKRLRNILSDHRRQSELLKQQDINMNILDENNKLLEGHLRDQMESIHHLFGSGRKQINKRVIPGLLQERLVYYIEMEDSLDDSMEALIETGVERSDSTEDKIPIESSEDKTPIESSEDKTPIESSEDKIPAKRSDSMERKALIESSLIEDEIPIRRSDSSEDKTPIESSEDKIPIKRSDSMERKALIESGLIEDEIPVRKSIEDKIPIEPSEDKTPVKRSDSMERKALIESGLIEDETPVGRSTEDKTPAKQSNSFPTAEDYRRRQEETLMWESR